MKLDDKDRQLLSRLALDGRASNRDLARGVGLSPSACLARVRRLEDEGFIVGYRAVIARDGSGKQVEGWADIRLLDPSPGSIARFVQLVEGAPEIVEAHRIAGRYDYIVRFCAGDLSAWNAFRRNIEALGCAADARFSVLVEPLK